MKNLFSAYRFNSVKQLILSRAVILGLLMILLVVAIILDTNHLSAQNDSLISYIEQLGNGSKEFSQQEFAKLKDSTSVYSIILWGSFTLLLTTLFIFSSQLGKYFLTSLEKIKTFSSILVGGDISNRITNINNKDEFGDIYWALNDTVDQFEALVKELTTSVEYISNRQFFRPVLSKGLNGTFALRLKKVDDSLKKYSNQLIQEKNEIEKKAERLLRVMENLSQGDLTKRLDIEDPDELMSKLYQGYNELVEGITQIIMEVDESVNSTVSVGNQIAASIEEMAAGAEEQNRQTSEIASSIDEMTKTVSETTKNTTAAAESARDSGNLAEEGSNVVKKAVLAMDSIANIVSSAVDKVVDLGKNSDKIGEIIQVIEEIADQTNLLALNAAIEAARAGEHGRGFAVVADEVRKLAERTTSATQEITGMISQIQKDTSTVVSSIESGNQEVQEGRNLNEEAGKAIHNIVEMANRVVDEINQVATASEEQSLTSSQIAQNIVTINNVSSESLAGIHHMAGAAADLNQTTENLKYIVNRFKFDKIQKKVSDNKFTANKKLYQVT